MYYGLSRYNAILDPKPTQIDTKILPKLNPKPSQHNLKNDLQNRLDKKLQVVDQNVPRSTPNEAQVAPRAAQRSPKGSPKGAQSRFFGALPPKVAPKAAQGRPRAPKSAKGPIWCQRRSKSLKKSLLNAVFVLERSQKTRGRRSIAAGF